MTTMNESFWAGKKIATMNTKGGVGKTTTCLHMGYQLKFKKGLVFQYVDTDAQESGTNHCNNRANLIGDCLGYSSSERSRPIPEDVKKLVKRIYKDEKPYVIPNIIKKGGFAAHFKESKGFYDGFIIDTQGADSKIGREIMVNSDIVIIPVNPSGLVVAELKKLIEVIMIAKEFNQSLKVFIVFNRVMANAKKIAKEHIDFVRNMLDDYLMSNHNLTKEEAMIQVCETVITERQDIYNNVDIGLNAFELSKGKTTDALIQFDTLLDEIEYLCYQYNEHKEVV
ncbi:ParA family protein [Pseudomonas aeruginosa]|uniref:ParA family protein n=1 Tax=Pseudomonas aeruginosa TaxID=287 RepID=UPI00104D3BD4|nr:ParA family protein [Pseudomonas aeruginosa]